MPYPVFEHVDSTGDGVEIRPSSLSEATALLSTLDGTDGQVVAVYVPKDVAPKLALALLEAAGWKHGDNIDGDAVLSSLAALTRGLASNG